MTEPGERRPPQGPTPSAARRAPRGPLERLQPRTLGMAMAEAVLVGMAAAVTWALLRGILELGVGLLAVAALGGWAIGTILWQVRAHLFVPAVIAGLAWLGGLVLTWIVAMARIQESSRTFMERIEATPFPEWLSPQFGLVEVVGLGLYVAAALYGARPRSQA